MKPEARLSKDWDLLMCRVPDMDGHESVENSVHNGTPDKTQTVMGIHSWAELKVAREPKRESTCIKMPHWSQLQRKWMQARVRCPTVFLVVRIGEWDYICDTDTMFTVETVSYRELKLIHPWRVKIGQVNFWTNTELVLLRDRLMGIKNKIDRRIEHGY